MSKVSNYLIITSKNEQNVKKRRFATGVASLGENKQKLQEINTKLSNTKNILYE